MGDPDRRPLVVRDLVVTYGDTRVVDGLSLDVAPGEVHGLVGESGCGKSTVAQAILRILPRSARVTAAELRASGDDVPSLDGPRLRSFRWRKASLALQSAMNALNPVMRIGEQIADAIVAHEPALSGARRDRRVAELLERVGISADRRRAYPHELSGGMRQRVVIAMALALRPPLVILDEPTTALDVVVQREILTELLARRDELGFAMLFITHDLSLLFEIATRITVMRDGRAVESAPAEELLRAPRHEYTRSLIASFPSLRGPRAAGVETEPAASPAERPILEVRGLSASYDESGLLRSWSRRRRVLEDVSFSLRRGEILALAGESGSGKSTIAGVIARLVPAASGEILLDGRDVLRAEPRRASAAYRRRVQMIFQDPYGSLNPAHTVGHHLERPLRRHAIVPSRDVDGEVVSLLEAVGLTPGRSFVDRRPDRLSGGQRQRVAIARALAARPDVILADEPTSMLDVSIRLGILNLMRRLRDERGVSFLHITHDLASARYVADRIAILHDGRIVESGPADRLLASPSHPYTRRLVAAVPDPWPRADVPTEEQRCEA